MSAAGLQSFYEERKSAFSASLRNITAKIHFISNARIVVALLVLVVLYFGFSNQDWFMALPVLLVVFVLLVRRHSDLFRQRAHLNNLVRIQENELLALQGDYSSFDSGAEFIDPHHPYTHDLDIFGEGSLFQCINRASTRNGKKLFARRLSSPTLHEAWILQHQEAVRELAGKQDFCHHYRAIAMETEELPGDQEELLEWARRKNVLYGKRFYRITLSVLPGITTGLVITSFFIDGLGGYAAVGAALQWAFLGFHLKEVNAFHQYISRKKNILNNYASLLDRIQQETFASPLMKELKANAEEAGRKVKKLASLVNAFDARLNSMTNLVVNSLLMYDLQCVYRLEKWKEENASHFETWLTAVREVEVIVSLATFCFNNPDFVFPVFNDEGTFGAESLGHPLIAAKERVSNDVCLDHHRPVMIITGANMAGKSTFLRTIGVNMVLAQAGAPVCARRFNCPLIEIRSGMRTADSLKEHQSYFYAELNRLKSIMDELRKGRSLLILLDEILKGTNSTDKQTGSVAFVKQLLGYSCRALVATHDLVLGDLENESPERVRNFCFEPMIENDQLSFDYKLKRGIAHKMNATFLMKKMGIIPD